MLNLSLRTPDVIVLLLTVSSQVTTTTTPVTTTAKETTGSQTTATMSQTTSTSQTVNKAETSSSQMTTAISSPVVDDRYMYPNVSYDICRTGIFLPIWMPNTQEINTTDRIMRGVVYLISLVYFFIGVSIVADRFMSSIEVITSKERPITIKSKDESPDKVVNVRVWNETISNLTLMALGSSAPEIMLSAVEIVGNNFHAGDLGPGTIVGSAAFNLFIIIGLCIYVIPDGEVRRIKHLRVFFVTSVWSVFAYVWLYIIIAVISPREVTIAEGVVTLIMFPTTVLTAYIADKYLMKSEGPKTFRASHHGRILIEGEAADTSSLPNMSIASMLGRQLGCEDELLAFEEQRKEYIDIIRNLRREYPEMDAETLEEKAIHEVMSKKHRTRAYYRVQAIRRLTGSGNVIRKRLENGSKSSRDSFENIKTTRVFFDPAHYTVMENVGTVNVKVIRKGGDLSNQVLVDYATEEGTASPGTDYIHVEDTLTFAPNQSEASIPIQIVDDDIFEQDETFYIKLSNLKAVTLKGDLFRAGPDTNLVLATPYMASITILDDDHSGTFQFDSATFETHEGVGDMELTVHRKTGARGRVLVPYRLMDGTAVLGRDYEAADGVLIFQDEEWHKVISVKIRDSEEYEKNAQFIIELLPPTALRQHEERMVINDCQDPNNMLEDDRIMEQGQPRLGENNRVTVSILESPQFKDTVDKVLKNNVSGEKSLFAATSLMRQLKEAFRVNAGDDDDDGDKSEPSLANYIMHYLTLFWKILFAIAPPVDYLGGWACFTFSIVWIGLLTAVIGDLASHFGCSIGLKDSVTAITFVALGTSVPDTFASKVAAVGDRTADSSVGNVMGSNAVNVFLGIGVAWTMAAIVRKTRNERFTMEIGNLGFSVVIFCILALFAIFLLLLRRRPWCGGELGGPNKLKYVSSMVFVSFWVIYVLISILEAYDIIDGF